MQVWPLSQEDPLEEKNGTLLQLFLLEESHKRRSLVGYSLWGCKELDVTECLSQHYLNILAVFFLN